MKNNNNTQSKSLEEKYLHRSDNMGFAAKLCCFATLFHSFILSTTIFPNLLETPELFDYLRNPPAIFVIALLFGFVCFAATITLFALSSHYRTKAEGSKKRG